MWLLYLAIMAVYSLAALGISLDGSRSRILAARNVKPRRQILLVHLLFLGILFNVLLLVSRCYRSHGPVAAFLTSPFYLRYNLPLVDYLLMGAGYVLAWIEQRFIYVDAKTGKSGLPDNLDFY
jgi:hypothetical protein